MSTLQEPRIVESRILHVTPMPGGCLWEPDLSSEHSRLDSVLASVSPMNGPGEPHYWDWILPIYYRRVAIHV